MSMARGGGLQTCDTERARQAQDAKAGSEALLGVWPDGLPFFDRLEADEALREAVISRIQKLRETGSMVDIIVDRGTVNLWGVVRTEEEKNGFRIAAEGTPGVRAVKDHLRVVRAS